MLDLVNRDWLFKEIRHNRKTGQSGVKSLGRIFKCHKFAHYPVGCNNSVANLNTKENKKQRKFLININRKLKIKKNIDFIHKFQISITLKFFRF